VVPASSHLTSDTKIRCHRQYITQLITQTAISGSYGVFDAALRVTQDGEYQSHTVGGSARAESHGQPCATKADESGAVHPTNKYIRLRSISANPVSEIHRRLLVHAASVLREKKTSHGASALARSQPCRPPKRGSFKPHDRHPLAGSRQMLAAAESSGASAQMLVLQCWDTHTQEAFVKDIFDIAGDHFRMILLASTVSRSRYIQRSTIRAPQCCPQVGTSDSCTHSSPPGMVICRQQKNKQPCAVSNAPGPTIHTSAMPTYLPAGDVLHNLLLSLQRSLLTSIRVSVAFR
jgi:hypothetical protein